MNAPPLQPIVAAPPAVRSVSRSHVGLVRAINEDRVLDAPAARLWAVADGMGGHRGGDLAAQTVIDRLRVLAAEAPLPEIGDVADALAAANAAIVARNRRFGHDAGTTVVAALVAGLSVHVAWVGDSRAYRLSDGRIELLTRDHSVVQDLVDAGLIDADMAERHPQANVVTRALGVADAAEPEFVTVALRPGDRLLLCSDGLSRSLRPAAVDHDVTLEQMADALLAGALANDGSDNISLALIAIDRP